MGKLAAENVVSEAVVGPALGPGGRGLVDSSAHVGHGRVMARYRVIGACLAASDGLCIVTALVLSFYIRFGAQPMPIDYVAVTATAPIVWGGVFYAFGLYAPQHLSASEIFRRIIGAASVGVVLLGLESFWTKSPFSRAWIGATWLLALLLELVVRRAWAWRLGALRRDGRLSFGTLIVGTDEEAERLARDLARPGSGFTPLGFVGLEDSTASPRRGPVLGQVDALNPLIRRSGADCVFVASTAIGADAMRRVTQAARQTGVEVRVSAHLPQILTSRLSVQQVGGTMALSLRPVRLTGGQALLKRAFDLVVAGAVVAICLPLYGFIAIAIRLTSPGPILFRQRRVTKEGRPFTVYKFRTMSRTADRALSDRGIDPSVAFFKLENDPRITPIGSILRRTSLDELPQLFNVIKGEMSLVGPRPLPVDQVEANPDLLRDRHEVLAGVTGWWQIHGRSSLTAEEAVNFDIFYIENWSLALDLYILLKTVGTILSQRGAA
jgi:exopolysaccharide biosynthesis polyprenyl glycosylphosphotransferase